MKDNSLCRIDNLDTEPYLKFRLLRLARDMSVNSVLPLLFYKCSIATNLETILSYENYYPGDLKTILLGREQVFDAVRCTVLGHVDELKQKKGCLLDRESSCLGRFHEHNSMLYARKAMVSFPHVTAEETMEPYAKMLCQTCLVHFKESIIKGRRDFWDKLPGYFGLPEWVELGEDV